MCQSKLTRREWIGVGATAILTGSVSTSAHAEPTSASVEEFPANAADALERLQQGNQRFVAGAPRYPHTELKWRREIEQVQKPIATILSCSDSRVPPELLFDQGFGDLFVIRVAGHVIDPSTLGSLQYALVHLHTPLFLVLGHERCGAVTAAVQALTGEHQEPKSIQALVDLVEPGLKQLDLHGDRDQVISHAVAANVRWTIEQLSDLCQDRAQAKIVGAVYELDKGEVRLLE